MINETYEGCNYVKPKNPELFCRLMIDCENGDIKNIKKHITCKEDTKQKLMWLSIKGGNCYVPEQSLLSIASRYGNIEIMKYLISLGTDVDDLDEYACTPLHFACLKRKENNVLKASFTRLYSNWFYWFCVLGLYFLDNVLVFLMKN